MARKVNKRVDTIVSGAEPILDIVEGRNDPQLTDVFNYYNYVYDDKQSHKWLLMWMKENKFSRETISIVRDSPTWAAGTTAGWVAKMAMNGTIFADENIDYVKGQIEGVIRRWERHKAEVEEEPKVVNIQARVRNKSNEIISLIESEVVDAFAIGDPNGMTMYNFLQKHMVTPSAANDIREYYIPTHDEVFLDDDQVKEAYGKNIKRWQVFWKDLIEDVDRYLNNKKVVKVRKPRTTRAKPLSKVVENLNYQKEFGPLKLVSANPQTIVGAHELWVFNTKNNIAHVFYAEGPNGFAVKGSTLLGWNKVTSTGKKLRKPQETISEILSGTKSAVKKILPALTTKENLPSGRINKDTILLRVMR